MDHHIHYELIYEFYNWNQPGFPFKLLIVFKIPVFIHILKTARHLLFVLENTFWLKFFYEYFTWLMWMSYWNACVSIMSRVHFLVFQPTKSPMFLIHLRYLIIPCMILLKFLPTTSECVNFESDNCFCNLMYVLNWCLN